MCVHWERDGERKEPSVSPISFSVYIIVCHCTTERGVERGGGGGGGERETEWLRVTHMNMNITPPKKRMIRPKELVKYATDTSTVAMSNM